MSRILHGTRGRQSVLYPRPNPGVVDGGLLLYDVAPKLALPAALAAVAVAKTESAFVTALAAGSAPTGPYAVTHACASTGAGSASVRHVLRVRKIGGATHRFVDVGGYWHSVTDSWGSNAVGDLAPPLLVPGGAGIEVAHSAENTNSAQSVYVEFRRGTPQPFPYDLDQPTSDSNYRYPPNTNPGGVAVTSGGVAWTYGAYAELVASLAGPANGWYALTHVSITSGGNAGSHQIALANAAAGVEAGYEFSSFGMTRQDNVFGWTRYRLGRPVMLRTGSRIAVKSASSGGSLVCRVAFEGIPVPYSLVAA